MGASLLAVAKSIYYELVSLVHGVDICLSYNTAHSKKKSQAKYRKTKRKSRATKDHRQSKLFHCINSSQKKKITIHL